MRPEAKSQWVNALRSGEYKQGKTFLNFDNRRFCCLGVLCEIAIQNGLQLQVEIDENTKAVRYGLSRQDGLLPGEVLAWAGLIEPNPMLRFKSRMRSLAALNDSDNLDFSAIANLIEEQL